MKRSRRSIGGWIVLVGLIALPATPGNAFACCTTVWDCVATVASHGVTCIIQINVHLLRNLIALVERERYEKQMAFAARMAEEESAALKKLLESEQKANKADRELEELQREAHKILGEDLAQWRLAMQKPVAQQPAVRTAPQQPAVITRTQPSGVSTTTQQSPAGTSKSAATALRPGAAVVQSPGATSGPTPAQSGPPQAYSATVNQAALRELVNDNSLESMHKQIVEERARARQAFQRLIAQKQKALKTLLESGEAAKIAFQNSFLEGALGILDGIVSGFDSEVTPAVEKDASIKQAAVAAVERPATETQKHADRARVILAEMRKSARFQTAAQRREVLAQLNALLSAPATVHPEPAIQLKPIDQMRITLKKTSADLRMLRPAMQRVMTAPPPDLRSARAQTGQHFDQFFKGKAPAEARKTRDELVMEARRRFAGDPKLLGSVEKLIREEAAARGVF